jgi:hypothetical protein
MLQKRQVSRSRRALAVERLEDRLVLSGNVFAFQNVFTGQLVITGDNGNNAFCINETGAPGGAFLTVTGSPTPPANGAPIPAGNVTAINFIAGGSFSVPLASVSEIDITEGNGTNFICLGNVTGFSLPGNIVIRVGTGVDTISLNNIATNAGVISIAPTPPTTGLSPVTLNVSETNIIAGASQIVGGTGTLTVTQNNVTLGFDNITAPGSANISITNSRFRPPPRTWAIGQLNINADTTVPGAGSTVKIDNINVGPTTININAGGGIMSNGGATANTLTFDDSTLQMANITIGSEAVGAISTNTVDISNDIVTGNFLNVKLLNESGVSGTLQNGMAGVGPGGINTFTENNVMFPGNGNENLRIDDGIVYYNRAGSKELDSASSVLMSLVDTGGSITVTLGDYFQSVMLGTGTVGLNDLDAKTFNLSIGNFNDIVVIATQALGEDGSTTISVGDVNTFPSPPVPPPSVLITGIEWNDGDENVSIKLGNNNRTDLAAGWPITVAFAVSGNLTIAPIVAGQGNGWDLTVTTHPILGQGISLPSGVSNVVTGNLNITMGNGGPGNVETLTLNQVQANDINIQLNSNSAQVPDTVQLGAFINLNQVNVTDAFGGLTLTDVGSGVDIASFTNVNVAEMLSVLLSSSGMNVLTAQNVTTCFGTIDGGTGFGNLYADLGGNYGYIVIDFVGH